MVSRVVIERLRVEGLRNVREAELTLLGRSALISGLNGAGKTTLLEALYLLARGRSFRGRKWGDLTTVGAGKTRVVGCASSGERSVQWLYERSGLGSGLWADGVPAGEVKDFGKRLSVRLIGENAQQLLEGDPGLRRRFLDWNLFHVEPGYGEALRRFRQTLVQRNAWLRQGGRGRCVWDGELIASGEHLERLRAGGIKRIDAAFLERAGGFDWLEGAEVSYREGVPQGKSLCEALDGDRWSERRVGYTRMGPHRGDFGLARGGAPLVLSRGQQKIAVCLLQLACAAVQDVSGAVRSLWLVDDLSGDLDLKAAGRIAGMLTAGEAQCMFTVVGDSGGEMRSLLPPDIRLFHVEQGRITDST